MFISCTALLNQEINYFPCSICIRPRTYSDFLKPFFNFLEKQKGKNKEADQRAKTQVKFCSEKNFEQRYGLRPKIRGSLWPSLEG
uniref:Uncharacterized protein n=1 Tax=Salix viminalis TaxID=40686 RepID=A0A6N2KY48_SALVM